MLVLTGVIYPFIVTEIATSFMPKKAYGSLLYEGDQLRGSRLIGQPFTADHYFWPRPSAADYQPLLSRGSNLGPTSLLLKDQVSKRADFLASSHSVSTPLPSDLLYASASGLDPHISSEAAHFQLERIANARALSKEDREKLRNIVEDHIEGRHALFGPLRLNVLLMNRELDRQFPLKSGR